jgi:hypothetical protein
MLQKLRIVAGLAVLMLMLVGGWKWRKVSAQETIRAIGISDAGLTLVTPLEPGFDGMIKGLIGENHVPELASLRDYSVILHNHSNQTVVAYYLRWEFTEPDGNRTQMDMTENRITRFLDGGYKKTDAENDGLGPTIAPQSWVVVTPRRVVKTGAGAESRSSNGRYVSHLEQVSSKFAEASDIRVSLDGAFFEDGSFVGPNESHFFEIIKSQVRAKQNLLSYIIMSVGQGRTVDDVANELKTSLPASRPELSRTADGSISGLDDYFRFQYVSEFLGVYRGNGAFLALGWAHQGLYQHPARLEKKSSIEGKTP